MFDLTIKEYLDAIQGLKINDFIIFYFTGYFFVVMVQRALEFEMDVGKFRTNPKILASLILVQLFSILQKRMNNLFIAQEYSLIDPYLQTVYVAMTFAVGMFCLRYIFISDRGVFWLVFSYFVWNAARSFKKIMRKQGKHISVNLLGVVSSARKLSKSSRSIKYLFLIDAYICVVLYQYMMEKEFVFTPFFYFFILFFMWPRLKSLVEHSWVGYSEKVEKYHLNEIYKVSDEDAEPINE